MPSAWKPTHLQTRSKGKYLALGARQGTYDDTQLGIRPDTESWDDSKVDNKAKDSDTTTSIISDWNDHDDDESKVIKPFQQPPDLLEPLPPEHSYQPIQAGHVIHEMRELADCLVRYFHIR